MWIVHLVVFVVSLGLSGLEGNNVETAELTQKGKGQASKQCESYDESQLVGTLQYEPLLKISREHTAWKSVAAREE
jgi:hypothetical protein